MFGFVFVDFCKCLSGFWFWFNLCLHFSCVCNV